MAHEDPSRTLPLIGRDIPYSMIEDELCHVVNFGNLSRIIGDKIVRNMKGMPYGYLEVKSKNLPATAMITITHKLDYMNVIELVDNQKSLNDTELCVIWSKSHYKKGISLFKPIMPNLWVLLFHKGYYEFTKLGKTHGDYDRDHDQKISYTQFMRPVLDIKPDVMD